MIKLLDILTEAKKQEDTFEDFAEIRGKGAEKITDNAKEKGGLAMLTWHHFKVKLPYYKKAAEGNFNLAEAQIELKNHLNELCSMTSEMEQIHFQELVGLIEVLGELIIKFK